MLFKQENGKQFGNTCFQTVYHSPVEKTHVLLCFQTVYHSLETLGGKIKNRRFADLHFLLKVKIHLNVGPLVSLQDN